MWERSGVRFAASPFFLSAFFFFANFDKFRVVVSLGKESCDFVCVRVSGAGTCHFLGLASRRESGAWSSSSSKFNLSTYISDFVLTIATVMTVSKKVVSTAERLYLPLKLKLRLLYIDIVVLLFVLLL
jgi:hypothetical protein